MTINNINEDFDISSDISTLKGVGSKSKKLLNNIDILTIKDILFRLPFRYELLNQEGNNDKAILSGIFIKKESVRTSKGKTLLVATFLSEVGYFYGIWFNYTFKYIDTILKQDRTYNLYGRISTYRGKQTIFHPELIDISQINSVRSIYSLPTGISQKQYHKLINTALEKHLPLLSETLPEYILKDLNIPDIKNTLQTLHNPITNINIEQIASREHPAIKRMIFEELFYLRLRNVMSSSILNKADGINYNVSKEILTEIASIMPFKLTVDQKKCIKEIIDDMKKRSPMNRLLQGDVGSGKTIIAFITALIAVKNGYQAAILAPTEVLAQQHYENLISFVKDTPYNIAFLSSSVKQKEKLLLKQSIMSGDINIVVGTHAIIQDDVNFKNLGIAIIDEQHRFGVKQRKAIIDKGNNPDILLMTATPIPRTLALAFYGDLELSEIRSMPPGRKPSITEVYPHEKRLEAFNKAKEIIDNKGRAYFIYPAIDDNEKSDLKSVIKNADYIKNFFPNHSVGLLHGKLKADEKNLIIKDFQTGAIDILVSTTVVEVGVDVKDANIIVIENADRFGLAQLHQLRGRVGRNNKTSYCILISSESTSVDENKRLQAMKSSNDGFKLAELDLSIRGQGDFFGIKQSGIPNFKYADIVKDRDLFNISRNIADKLIKEDPYLDMPENSIIKSTLLKLWTEEYNLYFVG